MLKRKYVFFVAFAYVNDEGHPAFGNGELTSPEDITDINAVERLTELMKVAKPEIKKPVIINFKYLRVERDDKRVAN